MGKGKQKTLPPEMRGFSRRGLETKKTNVYLMGRDGGGIKEYLPFGKQTILFAALGTPSTFILPSWIVSQKFKKIKKPKFLLLKSFSYYLLLPVDLGSEGYV